MAINSTTLDSPQPSLSPPSKFQLPSLPPLTISLTAGTDIPPPPPSPSPPPSLSPARAPTPAPEPQRQSPAERAPNPLSSHPTTPSDLMPGAFPPTPSPLQERDRPPIFPRIQPTPTPTSTSSGTNTIPSHTPSASPQTPTSPVSPSSATSTTTKRPSSVRRFLSLRSLNIGYLSNRDNKTNGNSISNSNSPSSPLSAPSPLSQQYQYQRHEARPASPLSTGMSSSPRPGLRKKKSASWFRRRSSMGFDELVNASGNGLGDGNGVEEVENRRPRTNASGEEMVGVVEGSLERPRSPPPRLPELGGLGVSLDVGGLGEGMFARIR